MIARIHTVWDSDLAINYPKLLDYFNVIIDKDIRNVNFNPNGRLPNSIAWDITIYDDYIE